MLKKKTRYAIVALISLAKHYGRGSLSISCIAERENIPTQFLERILFELKTHGYVDSIRGKTGGYVLAKNPAEIQLLSIICLMQDSISMVPCVCERKYKPCEFLKNEAECKLRKTFNCLHKSIQAILESTTLRDLV
jgi:Rrf2 family protein